jgi:hypothetical protein
MGIIRGTLASVAMFSLSVKPEQGVGYVYAA